MQIPQFLDEMLQKQYNNEITNKIIEGYKDQRNVTLRINTIKSFAFSGETFLDFLFHYYLNIKKYRSYRVSIYTLYAT